MKRILFVLVLFILAIIIVAIVVSYFKFRKSLPKTAGTVEIHDLRNKVEIYRDQHGIPHIFAQNEYDLYFSQGYVTAQDRLWQLEMKRRLVNGRMSEVLGDTTLSLDRLSLTIGFKRIANRIYPELSDKSKSVIKAYTDGINHYISTHKGAYPVEFMVLNCEPGLWHPEDCIALSRFIGWELSFSWYVELVVAKVNDKLGAKYTNELFGDYLSKLPSISGDLSQFEFNQFLKTAKQITRIKGTGKCVQGSNNWVVDGSKSVSGKPMLANDPHLLLTNPSQWHMIHLFAPGVDVAGFTFPGSPGVIIGFNGKIAWGYTNVMADDMDFFIETINSNDATQYMADGQWREMKKISETIPIQGKDDKRFDVFLTRHGPIINQVHPQTKDFNRRIALRWTGQELSDETLAVYRLNRAENWQQFKRAIRDFNLPAQNIVYADVKGNIGYWCAGFIPIRSETEGMYPHQNGSNWQGFIPFEQKPHDYNPLEGFLATANNPVSPKNYPYYISHLWEPPSRIMRIKQLLQQKEKLNANDFEMMQKDVYSEFAAYLLPEILPELKELGEEKGSKFQKMYQFLKGWDAYVRSENVAATLFHVFLQHFLHATFSDELGTQNYHDYLFVPSFSLRAVRKIYDLNINHWFDDVTTTKKKESESNIVTGSWQKTLEYLENQLGKDQIKWRWDKIHEVIFKHFLSDQPMMSTIFDVGPLPKDGSHTTINNGTYNFNEPYDCIAGPSMRMIVDLSDPNEAEVINPPGQVGHPLSKHYRDQSDYWINGLYITLNKDTTSIKNSDYDMLILAPLKK